MPPGSAGILACGLPARLINQSPQARMPALPGGMWQVALRLPDFTWRRRSGAPGVLLQWNWRYEVMKLHRLGAVLSLALCFCGVAATQDLKWESVKYRAIEDIVYGHKDGMGLTMDALIPETKPKNIGVRAAQRRLHALSGPPLQQSALFHPGDDPGHSPRGSIHSISRERLRRRSELHSDFGGFIRRTSGADGGAHG